MALSLAEALRAAVPATEDQARLLTFMREHRDRLPQLSFDEIARASGVSQPTVTRMTRKLGYANALELRAAAAAAMDVPGRLPPEQVQRGAELLRSGDDLHVFAPEHLDGAVRGIFRLAFPKTDVELPMKPQIARRGIRNTPQRFNEGDAALVLAVNNLPDGYDFQAEFRNAQMLGVPVLILQATTFEVPGIPDGSEALSLSLAPDVYEAIAGIHLAAAAAEIRTRAALA